MRLLLVRHGQTDANRDGLALGRADVPLNDLGVSQAAALARRLAAEPLGAVYSSPLQRCLHTARAIAAPHRLAVAIEDDLIEMDVGELDGLELSVLRTKYPEFLERWLGPDGPHHPLPGGESLAAVAARAWRAVQQLRERHGGQTVAAVTHNFVILTILARAMGTGLANFRQIKHGVAAISVLDVQPHSTQVLALNDASHLEAE